MPDVCPIGTEIQTVLVPHSKFPTLALARAWVVEHGFRATKVDEGKTVARFRQLPPSHFEPKSFRTIPLGSSGVQAVIGCPRQTATLRKIAKSGRARGTVVKASTRGMSDAELRERMKKLLGKK